MERMVSVLLGVVAAKSALAALCCCGAGPIGLVGILADPQSDGPPAAFALVFYWGLAVWQAGVGTLCGVTSWRLYHGQPTSLPVIAATVGAASGLLSCDMINIALCVVAFIVLVREPPS